LDLVTIYNDNGSRSFYNQNKIENNELIKHISLLEQSAKDFVDGIEKENQISLINQELLKLGFK